MKLLYCVQRYGEDVAGGSEAACRSFAERMAARGHDVHVATSCARSYVDWANHYPEGTNELNGVTVHRFPVRERRTHERFGPIHARVMTHPTVPLHVQRDWLRIQGPDVPSLTSWIDSSAADFDAAVFFTYLYPTTAFGLPAAAKACPTILVPTAHDEPMFHLRVFDSVVRRADGIVFLTPEEYDLFRWRFRYLPYAAVNGIGLEADDHADPGRFRAAFGLATRPYIVVVGRVDPGKGADELHRYFVEYKRRNPSDLALVVVGEPVVELAIDDDIVFTGHVDEQTKQDAIAGAELLVQPSYFESFSLALCEGWLGRKAALVQGRCEVLAGQSRRSAAGLPYTSFGEFSELLTRLLADAQLRAAMGARGRAYVLDRYDWSAVIARHEHFVERVIAQVGHQQAVTAPVGDG